MVNHFHLRITSVLLHCSMTGFVLGFWWHMAMNAPISPISYASFTALFYIGTICSSLWIGKSAIGKSAHLSIIQLSCLPSLLIWFCIAEVIRTALRSSIGTVYLLVGRFLTGIVLGVTLTSGSLYLMEISPSIYICQFALLVPCGLISGLTLAQLMTYQKLWLHTTFVSCLVLYGLEWMLWLSSESMSNGKKATTCRSCTEETDYMLRTDTSIGSQDLSLVSETVENPACHKRCFLRVIHCGFLPSMSNNVRTKAKSIWTLVALQQLTGVGALMNFAESIFCAAGSTPIAWYALAAGCPQVLATGLCLLSSLRCPRKLMIQCSTVVMSFSFFVLGVLLRFDEMKPFSPFLALFIILCLVGYSLAWGPLPLVIVAEAIPCTCRGPVLGLAVALSTLLQMVVVLLFEPLCVVLTVSGTFWLWGLACIACGVHVSFRMPETHALQLDAVNNRGNGIPLLS